MNENKNKNYELINVSKEANNQSKASKSWKKSLKTTAVASAVSLAILGLGQVPLDTITGNSDGTVHAQTRNRNQDSRALRAYFNNGFNYVDAKVLGSYWRKSPGDSKVFMGYKLLNMRRNEAMRFIREARGLALERSRITTGSGGGYISYSITYEDGGYKYNDVDALSRYWKKDMAETKLLIETMLISGKSTRVDNAMRNAKNTRRF